MYRRALGLTAVTAAATACFLIPDSYYPGSLKPVSHMFNVVKAGAQMAYVYKFTDQDIHAKHREACEYLK